MIRCEQRVSPVAPVAPALTGRRGQTMLLADPATFLQGLRASLLIAAAVALLAAYASRLLRRGPR